MNFVGMRCVWGGGGYWVEYINGYAKFFDSRLINISGQQYREKYILIAIVGKPIMPDIGVTSNLGVGMGMVRQRALLNFPHISQ